MGESRTQVSMLESGSWRRVLRVGFGMVGMAEGGGKDSFGNRKTAGTICERKLFFFLVCWLVKDLS